MQVAIIFINIFTEVNLTGKKICGGVIGSIKEYCSAKGLSASGKVTGETIVGGVSGEIYGNSKKEDKQDIYSDLVSKAEVTATKGNAGGIVSEITENASLSDCVNFGTVMGMNIGGIASTIGIYSKYALWKVTSVTRCENHGELKSSNEVKAYKSGGIAANLRMQNSIKDCYSDANVTAKEECGGIVGYNDRGYIENCYAIGELKTEYYDSKVGGISGMFFAPTGPSSSKEYATIKNCFITNDTKFSFKGKPSDSKNGTNKCCSEEPTYKESYSNLQRFNSVSDIKLDSSWNPEVWDIKPGCYPIIKRDVIGGVVHSYTTIEQTQEQKINNTNSIPVETKTEETKPTVSQPIESKPAEKQPAEIKSEDVKPSENAKPAAEPAKNTNEKSEGPKPAAEPANEPNNKSEDTQSKPENTNKAVLDTKEYKPVELKPFKTHPNVVVPEELELEP